MPKNTYFSKKQLEEIKSQAMAFWHEATNKQTPFFDKVKDYNRLYHVQLPKALSDEVKAHKDRAHMVPPDIYNNVLSLRANINRLLFGQKPYGTVTIEGQPNSRPESVVKAERKLSELIDVSNFEMEADKALHQTLLAGRSCVFTEWKRIYRPIPIRDEDSRKATGSAMRFVTAYPSCKGLDIRRVRIDDKAENIEDIRLVAYHAKVNESDFLIWNNDPNNRINFNEEELKHSTFHDEKYYEHVDEEKVKYDKTVEAKYGDKPVELMDFRGHFRIDGKYLDLVVKIANRDVLVEARPNDLPIPGYELFDFPSIDSEYNRLYPMGVIEPALDIFIEEFIKRNQSLDASNRRTYDQYLADEAAVADLPSRIPNIPGGIIKVRLGATGATSVGQIFAPIPRAASYVDTFQHAMSLQNDVQQTMRMSDYKQGTDPSRKETATAVDALTIGGKKLDEQIVMHLKHTFLAPVWKKYLILWNYFEGHKEHGITGDDATPMTIGVGELDQPWEISIDVSSAVERPMMIRRTIEAYPMMIGDPFWDQYELRKNLAWALNLPNPDKLLPNPGHKQMIIDRENAAMLHGAPQEVHPLDDHRAHVPSHMDAAGKIADNPEMQDVDRILQIFDKHVTDHQQHMEDVPNPAGQNTPKADKNEPTQGQMAGGLAAKNPYMGGKQPTSSAG